MFKVIGLLVMSSAASLHNDYALSYAYALVHRQPFVVGVGCIPPEGPWVSVTVPYLQGYEGPVVVLSQPEADYLKWVKTFDCSARRAEIERALIRSVTPPISPPIFIPQLQPLPTFRPSFAPSFGGGGFSGGGGGC